MPVILTKLQFAPCFFLEFFSRHARCNLKHLEAFLAHIHHGKVSDNAIDHTFAC